MQKMHLQTSKYLGKLCCNFLHCWTCVNDGITCYIIFVKDKKEQDKSNLICKRMSRFTIGSGKNWYHYCLRDVTIAQIWFQVAHKIFLFLNLFFPDWYLRLDQYRARSDPKFVLLGLRNNAFTRRITGRKIWWKIYPWFWNFGHCCFHTSDTSCGRRIWCHWIDRYSSHWGIGRGK